MNITAAITMALLAGSAAFSQQSVDDASATALKGKVDTVVTMMNGTYTFSFGAAGPAVKNQPYAAEAVTETSQTLLNGTHIRKTSAYSIYRDSDGRQRREMKNSEGVVEEVMISDPVAGVSYSMNIKDQVARKMTRPNLPMVFRTAPDRNGDAEVQSGNLTTQAVTVMSRRSDGGANSVSQSLGTQTINGVAAEGTRVTRTIAAGSIGNDQPIETINESWYSADLQTVVKTRRSDPRTGETDFELTNIRRSEPDPTLFQVPASFRIVNQK